jgi:Beta-propeller repeat
VVNPANPAFLLYSSYLGGADGEVGFDIAADTAGFLYITGYTVSANFPTTANAPQPLWGRGIDIFVTKLQRGGAGLSGLQWSTYVGGKGSNSGLALVVGPNGTIYVAGYAGGQFQASSNATQGAFDGGFSDGFILVISQP